MLGALAMTLLPAAPAGATSFSAGSLIIPMDLNYQDRGMLQAYGLVHALLRHGITVHWLINPNKVDSDACRDTPQGCWWDCEVQGDGVPCPYHTRSPDLVTTAAVLHDDAGLRPSGTTIPVHGYRGGPFVIDAARVDEALPIIEAWNRPELWAAHPWAARPVFTVVTVHQATQGFFAETGLVLSRAPTPGLLIDGAEGGFAGVLRAAGIPQSDGGDFSDAHCEPGTCGPGTTRPDFIPLEALVAFPDPCPDPHPVWADTLLINSGRLSRLERYALIATGGFGPAARETFLCEDGPCAPQDATCLTAPLLYHGHQIQRHLHAYVRGGGDLFALGEAVYGIENTPFEPALPAGDPAPYFGLAFRRISWPPCPCPLEGFSCVADGCRDAQGVPAACCWPDDPAVRGAGAVPMRDAVPGTLTWTGLATPLLQLDGNWNPVPGPWGVMGTNTPIGSSSPYEDDVRVMSGDEYLVLSHESYRGHVHHLADLELAFDTPVSAHPGTQAARLFLNALLSSRFSWDVVEGPRLYGIFGSDEPYCVGPTGTYDLMARLRLWGPLPVDHLDELSITLRFPAGVEPVYCEGAPTGDVWAQFWHLADVDRDEVVFDCLLRFTGRGVFRFRVDLAYRWGTAPDAFGTSSHENSITLIATADTDGDGVVDCADPSPRNPAICGDLDGDGHDDCSRPNVDAGPDATGPTPPPDDGCACAAGSRRPPAAPWSVFALALVLARPRRRRRRH